MSGYKIWNYEEELRIASKEPGFERLEAEVTDEMYQESISFWFNIYRKRQKITQKMIARKLFISQSAVCQMLKRPVTVGTIARLCEAMDAEFQINVRFPGEDWKSLILGDDPLSPEDQAMVDVHLAAEAAAKAAK